jgi:hypothetical protein
LILLSSPIPFQTIEVDKLVSINAPTTTTVYDAQATNLDGGTIDEGITYSIKGTNADKYSITVDKLVSFTDIVISCSALLPARSEATMVTISLSCTDVCFSV